MRTTYIWLARLIAVGVVLQAAFVAFGTFEVFNAASDGKAFTEDTDYNTGQALHGMFGLVVIPLLALILLIVAFLARIPGGARLAGAVFGLVVLQLVLGLVSFSAPVLGILHGLNAFALAGAAGYAGRRAGQGQAGSAVEAAAA